MSETALILCPADTLKPAFIPEAYEAKEFALAGVALIGAIKNQEQNAAAVAAVSEVTALKKRAIKAHKEAKEPYLRVCQALDKARNDFVAELDAEELRVNILCGNFKQEELEKVREAERERQRELDRIEAARLAEEQRIAEEIRKVEEARLAEQHRLEQEALGARGKAAKHEAARKLWELMAQRADDAAKADAERKDREALAVQEREAVAPVVPMATTKGQTVKAQWTFEVLNIIDLARVRPDLVEMTPRTAAIKEVINLGTRKLAGLRIFEEVKTYVKAGAGKTIDV